MWEGHTVGFPWLAQRMLVPIAFASKAALWCFVWLVFSSF